MKINEFSAVNCNQRKSKRKATTEYIQWSDRRKKRAKSGIITAQNAKSDRKDEPHKLSNSSTSNGPKNPRSIKHTN